MKNAITAKKLTQEENKKQFPKVKHIIEQQKLQPTESIKVNDNSTPKLNTFLFLGVFPIVATGTLVYFNDEMREDFMNKFGIKAEKE